MQTGVLGGSREQLVDTQAGAGMPVKLAPRPHAIARGAKLVALGGRLGWQRSEPRGAQQ